MEVFVGVEWNGNVWRALGTQPFRISFTETDIVGVSISAGIAPTLRKTSTPHPKLSQLTVYNAPRI
jgi:hypothetical protein